MDNRDYNSLEKQMETLKQTRQSAGMNRSEFSRYMNIPLRTLEDWETGKRKMPDYVLRLIVYYVQMEQYRKNTEMGVKEETDGYD